MKFSVVIPAHNESENLNVLLPRLKTALGSLDCQILVVDNASTDDSQEMLRAFKATMPELVIEKEPTLGYGRAVIAGLRSAKGDAIGIIRADNQEKSEDLVLMYKLFSEGNFDLYKAVRKNRIHDGLTRIIISKIYNLLFRLFFRTRTRDINATPKIFTRELYEKLKLESNDWFIDAEIVIKAANFGCRIGEMEIEYLPRLKGKSNVKPAHLYQFIKNMLIWRSRIQNRKLSAK